MIVACNDLTTFECTERQTEREADQHEGRREAERDRERGSTAARVRIVEGWGHV